MWYLINKHKPNLHMFEKEILLHKEEMKSCSSQVHVALWISVMENQEIYVITCFYGRGKSKADYIRKESAHIVIPKDVGLSKLKRIFT